LLLELYHVVWHFNPTCAAAASRLTDEHPEVRYFLYDHMMEEKGHEGWVANDLEVVGVPRRDIVAYQPSNSILALNGYNYWSADRRHPCSILGMMYALEVIASVYGGPIAAAIKESLLLEGDRGISFITSHVTMDAEHMAELRVILNTIEDDESRFAITESTTFNFEQFTRVLEAI
jgi:pyrroloquinoline quinone (PQQ) biosynthesis protein C